MSTVGNWRGPNIVKDGLVLYMDSSSPNSYYSPSSGITWSDISGNFYEGTLTNVVTYIPINGGTFLFDGANSYITNIGNISSFSFIQNTAVFTIDVWVKPYVLGGSIYIMGNNDGTSGAKGFFLGKLSDERLNFVLTYGVGGMTTLTFRQSNYFTDTNWVNIVISCNGVNAIAYKNGIQFGSISSTVSTLSTGDSSSVLGIGRINQSTTQYWNGYISTVKIYNRSLSPQEVLQNFNSVRSRFGI